MTSIRDEIRDHLEENLLYGRKGLADEASLLDAGLIDSTGVLELVTFLEDRFGLTVEDADIVPANFDSVAGLATYVEARLHTASRRATIADSVADHAD
jgi:acyl carrier protein